MTFSVLMTVYAKENPDYFEMAVDSVIGQQILKPNDFVLVKDGPLTPELDKKVHQLVERYPIIRVFALPENVGQGQASAFGLEQCRYDWVARMDSDDIAVPERFERQVAYLEQHPDIVVLGGQMGEFSYSVGDSAHCRLVPTDYDSLVKFAKKRNPMNNVTTMFRKSVITNEKLQSELRFGEDYELFARLLIKGYKLANLDHLLVYARVGDSIANKRSGTAIVKGYRYVANMMYTEKFISRWEYLSNMLSVYLLAYMPKTIRGVIYGSLLRVKK